MRVGRKKKLKSEEGKRVNAILGSEMLYPVSEYPFPF